MITVRSITEAIRHVRRGEDVCAEGICGRIDIWPDEQGWVCKFSRFEQGLRIDVLDYVGDLHDWLRTWFPQLKTHTDPRGDHRRNPGPSRLDRRRQYAPKAKGKIRR